MDIVFANKHLRKQCNDKKSLIKAHGPNRANRIQRRLDDLRSAVILEDMRNLPGRCHELLHNRAGQLSVDLDHPYRLIFVPANDPIPRKSDGGLDWKKVTAIEIIDITNTHE